MTEKQLASFFTLVSQMAGQPTTTKRPKKPRLSNQLRAKLRRIREILKSSSAK
jgi:hypothetical protein